MTRPWRRTLVWSFGLLAAASAALAAEGPPIRPRTGPTGPQMTEGRLSGPGRDLPRRPAVSLGETGLPAPDADKPFSLPRALDLADRIERMGDSGARAADEAALDRALALLPGFRRGLERFGAGGISSGDLGELRRLQSEMENLEGIALDGEHRLASYREARSARGRGESADPPPEELLLGVPKVNTGWIYDQHLFDADLGAAWPQLLSDYRNFDEGRNDIAMGRSEFPGGGLFGYMWHVQSFYVTDTWSDHPNPSYCLFILVSGDGGVTWQAYDYLYHPSATASRDLLNPRLALAVTGAYDIFYIVYELAVSETNHDIYIYYDVSTLPFYDGTPGGTSSPVQVGLATSVNMERNPAIASEYKTADATRYQVVAWEYDYSPTDTDIRARQSYGNGSASWTAATDVAYTPAMETHPTLTAGSTGGSPFTSYVHLAYNYDTYTTGTTQLLLNPGFESGDDGSWTVRTTYDIDCSGSYDRTGSCAAWLGGIVDYPSWPGDWIYQTVTIPFTASSAQLTFWLRIDSYESGSTPYDYFYADIRDTSDGLLQNLVTLSNANETTYATYQQLTYDLSAYRGQTVRLYFWATNDGTLESSFFVDDAALNVGPYDSASEVRYASAAHPTGVAPGAPTYPSALANATKLTVLANAGGTSAWPYGPPAIGASHGGGVAPLLYAEGRVLVATDQHVPKNQPKAGDPERYQLAYAVNMCNGGATCTEIPGCSPALPRNWNAYTWSDTSGDYRCPSIVVDGVGWVEGSSGIQQNGVTGYGPTSGYPRYWNSEMFLAYYYRSFKSPSLNGGAHMDVLFADEEDCAGFQSGVVYYFTASEKASDEDDLVVAREGTLNAFNYFAGWPGIVFNKSIYHPGGTTNEDPYFTTLGDNYTIDTTAGGTHIDAYWSFGEETYLGPWTFPWPAGFLMPITVNEDAAYGGRYYTFVDWSTKETSATVEILTGYCPPSPPCPVTTINAQFQDGGCPVPPPATRDLLNTRQGGAVRLDWNATWNSGDISNYRVYRATDCSFAANYAVVGSPVDPTFTDYDATGPLYFYIVATTCGPYVGPWDHYGQ